MIRKLVKQGDNALTLTLPAKWVKGHNLKPGNEINILEEGRTLVISTDKTPESKTYEITLDPSIESEEYYIKRLLASIYKREYDVIILHIRNPKTFELVEKAVNELMGFEITHQTTDTVTIKNISQQLEDNFEEMYKDSVNHVLKGVQLLNHYFETKDKKIIAEILLLEKMNNKFTDVLKRSLNRSGYYDTEKTLFYYSMVRDIEKMVDEYRDTCKYLEKSNIVTISAETKGFFKLLEQITKVFVELNFVFSYSKVNELREARRKVKTIYPDILTKVPKDETPLVASAFIVMQEIFELIGSLFCIHLPPSAKK